MGCNSFWWGLLVLMDFVVSAFFIDVMGFGRFGGMM